MMKFYQCKECGEIIAVKEGETVDLTGKEEIICTGLRPGEKLYEELLLDKENDKATERDRLYVAHQEKYDWATVESMLNTLEDCLERHGDIKACMKNLLPTYHEAG